jgi:inner membrane transporter RhtA
VTTAPALRGYAGPAAPAFTDPLALAAAVGVGVSSSVIPYVCDQPVRWA